MSRGSGVQPTPEAGVASGKPVALERRDLAPKRPGNHTEKPHNRKRGPEMEAGARPAPRAPSRETALGVPPPPARC